ncbi:MAG TPA: carboxypeptidase-like regulatory domain-containing protein, partial [Flavobacteriales bacterium]|nr:carboxypeptidase-like regulatory domain-containing protein [Flavobacteriales bacterium]
DVNTVPDAVEYPDAENGYEGPGSVESKMLETETGDTDKTLNVFVKDSSNMEALPFSKVTIMEKGKTVAQGICDANGIYTIKRPLAGIYTMQIQQVGYKTKEIPLILAVGGLKVNEHEVKLTGQQPVTNMNE